MARGKQKEDAQKKKLKKLEKERKQKNRKGGLAAGDGVKKTTCKKCYAQVTVTSKVSKIVCRSSSTSFLRDHHHSFAHTHEYASSHVVCILLNRIRLNCKSISTADTPNVRSRSAFPIRRRRRERRQPLRRPPLLPNTKPTNRSLRRRRRRNSDEGANLYRRV